MINDELTIPKKQKLLVITGISGADKSSVAKKVSESRGDFIRCPTSTNREKRPGEIDELDYFFYSLAHFELLRKNPKFFFEHEEVYPGRHYAVPYCPLQNAWRLGKTPLISLNPKGANKFKTAFPDQVKVVWLSLPDPIVENAEKRLIQRGNMSPKDIRRRLFEIHSETEISKNFKHHVVNHHDALGQTIEYVSRIISQ